MSVVGTNSKIGFTTLQQIPSECNQLDLLQRVNYYLPRQENSIDLKQLIRNKSNDREAIKTAIITSIKNKPKEHFFELQDKPVILRFMSHTGG